MKVETIRCDLCGRVCTNKSENIFDKDYCHECMKAMGVRLYIDA